MLVRGSWGETIGLWKGKGKKTDCLFLPGGRRRSNKLIWNESAFPLPMLASIAMERMFSIFAFGVTVLAVPPFPFLTPFLATGQPLPPPFSLLSSIQFSAA